MATTKSSEIRRILNSANIPVRMSDLAAIIDYIDQAELPYKKYVALLNQTGTDAPVATVLENTLGATPIWTRANQGYYNITLTGAFDITKTFVINSGWGTNEGPFIFESDSSPDSLYIDTYLISSFSPFAMSLQDGQLINYPIEIRIYP